MGWPVWSIPLTSENPFSQVGASASCCAAAAGLISGGSKRVHYVAGVSGLRKPSALSTWKRVNNRSVMPLDALGRTRATMGGLLGSTREERGVIRERLSSLGLASVKGAMNQEFLVGIGH